MTQVKPTVENGKLVSIELDGVTLPLKAALPIADLPKLVDSAEKFAQYVDLSKLSRQADGELPAWSPDSLKEFIRTSLRDDQATALEILTENKRISRDQFKAELKKRLKTGELSGYTLGGILAGVTVKAKSYGRESPYNSDWLKEGGDYVPYYWIPDKYKDTVAKALGERQ